MLFVLCRCGEGRGFVPSVSVGGLIEEGVKLIVLALRNRVVLVAVAFGTAEGQTHPDLHRGIDAILDCRHPELFVVGPTLSARTKVELQGSRASTPALLAAAGITVGLTTDHPQVPIHLLAMQAAVAVRAGLDRDVALKAISESPAQIYRLGDRVGALRPGLDSDVVLWSGDPLDVQSEVLCAIVDGRVVYSPDQPHP